MFFKKTLLFVFLFSFLFPFVSFADEDDSSSVESIGTVVSTADTMSGSQMDSFMGASGISGSTRVENVIIEVIRAALSMLAIIFVILVIFSGYQWMTAGGNEEQVKKAQSRIKNAIIGLAIIAMAYAITFFVFQMLPGGGGGSGPPGGAGPT